MLWTSCANNTTTYNNNTNDDVAYFSPKIKYIDSIIKMYNIKFIDTAYQVALVNASICKDCHIEEFNAYMNLIKKSKKIKLIIVTENNDAVVEDIKINIRYTNAKLIIDTNNFLIKKGFSYPKHMVLSYNHYKVQNWYLK